MLIKVTTINGRILINPNLIGGVTCPAEEGIDGSILWCSKKNLPDCGYAGDDALVRVEETLEEIHAQLVEAGRR